MDGVRFHGAAAAVRPRAFVDATTHAIPSRSVLSIDTASLAQSLHLASENASPLRRLRSDGDGDVPASANLRPRRQAAVPTAASTLTDLKKLSRRRAQSRQGRDPPVEPLDPDANAAGLLNDSLYARLEIAYRQPSFETLMSDFEAKLASSILKDEDVNLDSLGLDPSAAEPEPESPLLENTSRRHSQVTHTPDPSSSSSTPKAVKKRRSNVEGNRILKITKNPVTRRPRKLAVIPKNPVPAVEDAPPVAVVVAAAAAERGGKRRLSLRSRIAMKQRKQQDSSAGVLQLRSVRPEDQDLWSPEVDELINTYSTALDLTAPLWDNLDRGLLTAAEENRLAMHMKPAKKLEKVHKVLVKQLGREPSEEEWASAAGVELAILRRRLALGRAARIKLIQRNLRLVLSQAYKYHKESMSLSIQDLCQEGVVGLMQAVDKFDPGKGYRFSTYGIYWIRNSILRAQTKSGHMLRSPHNVSTHRVNIKRAKLELGAELGRPPTNEEIRQHLGIAADRFRDILRTNMRTSSLHEHDRVTGRERVETLVSDEDALSTYARGISMVQYGIDDVLDSLRPKENLVLRQRFGLDGKGQRSLSEVGLILNLSREMVRRHELRGILKLQHPTRVEYLRNYLN